MLAPRSKAIVIVIDERPIWPHCGLPVPRRSTQPVCAGSKYRRRTRFRRPVICPLLPGASGCSRFFLFGKYSFLGRLGGAPPGAPPAGRRNAGARPKAGENAASPSHHREVGTGGLHRREALL